MRWEDIEQIDQHKTVVILRTERRVESLGRRWDAFKIAVGALEISQRDLVTLIQSVRQVSTSNAAQSDEQRRGT